MIYESSEAKHDAQNLPECECASTQHLYICTSVHLRKHDKTRQEKRRQEKTRVENASARASSRVPANACANRCVRLSGMRPPGRSRTKSLSREAAVCTSQSVSCEPSTAAHSLAAGPARFSADRSCSIRRLLPHTRNTPSNRKPIEQHCNGNALNDLIN